MNVSTPSSEQAKRNTTHPDTWKPSLPVNDMASNLEQMCVILSLKQIGRSRPPAYSSDSH